MRGIGSVMIWNRLFHCFLESTGVYGGMPAYPAKAPNKLEGVVTDEPCQPAKKGLAISVLSNILYKTTVYGDGANTAWKPNRQTR
jgi:hypothetical protein